MKKSLAILTALCIICTSGLGAVAASATAGTTSGSIGITPFASSDISSVGYSITSSKYSANITFTGSKSGSVSMQLQRKSGTSWVNTDSTSWTFSSAFSTSGSKNFSITTKGTYRISLTITIGGVATSRQSGEFSI